MLEIILLVFLGKKIGAALRNKGIRPGGYQFMLVIFWFGGEFLGFFIGSAITNAVIGAYFCALIGAALGAWITFGIVKSQESTGKPLEDPDAATKEYEKKIAQDVEEGRKRMMEQSKV